MEHQENQIVVWVGQEEKIVLGLTKHTTCADIVQALLEEHDKADSNSFLLGQLNEYCIVEKWRGCERVLPPPTKILKLWRAWENEQSHLNFVLVKTDAFLPIPVWRSAEAKITPTINRKHQEYRPAHFIKALPLEKRKRIIRKAFRKLANLKKDAKFQEINNLETLLHVIMSQDHTIKQQVQRIEELDEEIQTKEVCLHLERMEKDGKDYVRDLYLKPACPAAGSPKKQSENYFLDKKKRQEEMIEEKLNTLQKLIINLSADIEEEIFSLSTEPHKDKEFCDDSKMKPEEYDLKSLDKELDDSLQVGLHLHYNYECIQEQIKCNDSMLLKQEREYKRLEEELQSLCISDTNNPLNCQVQFPANNCTVNKTEVADSFAITLCSLDIHETDSDTGISSGHSQDSEPA